VTSTTFQWTSWSGTPVARYRLLPGDRIEYEIIGLAHLSGATNFVGIEWTAPASMASGMGFVGSGDVFNDSARVNAEAGIISCYPTGAYNASSYLRDMVNNNRTAAQTYTATGLIAGQWQVDNFDRWVRIHGFYSTT
jgi:hypothetical protein